MTNGTIDAIEMLKDDHRKVEALFKQYEQISKSDDAASSKDTVADEICEKLTVHAQVEEEVFYPAARQVLNTQKLIDEAEAEHAEAKQLIAQIEEMSPEDDAFDTTVKSLRDAIAHHVQEEENEMFPKLKAAGMETRSLGQKMAKRKQELMGELGIVEATED